MTILTLLPSDLTTKNPGEHHSVGSWHGVLSTYHLFASNYFIHFSAGSLKCKGICLAADTLKGVAFAFRCKCTTSNFIDVMFSSSLNTFGNCLRMSNFDDVSTDRADGLGKMSLITPRQIRWCHESSTGRARFDVTRALLNTASPSDEYYLR